MRTIVWWCNASFFVNNKNFKEKFDSMGLKNNLCYGLQTVACVTEQTHDTNSISWVCSVTQATILVILQFAGRDKH